MTSTYSHGLEKIYSFEVLNPHTVRRVETQPQTVTQEIKKEIKSDVQPANFEYFFDFGPQFNEGLPSIALDESVETLGLTPFQMKAVVARGVKTVGELIHDLPHMKTHADEIRQKIREVVGEGNNPFERKKRIDWYAFCRKTFSHSDAKERYCFLDSIGMKQLFQLKPVELSEVEKWPPEMRLKAIQRTQEALIKEKEYFLQKWCAISDSFLVPWLEKRMGFGQEFELEERVISIGKEPSELSIKALSYVYKLLFSEPSLSKPSLFWPSLHFLEEGLYAATKLQASTYFDVMQRAKDYFYSPFSTYPLEWLVSLLTRDFAKEWIGHPPGYIRKVLLASPSFQLFRNGAGIIFMQKRH